MIILFTLIELIEAVQTEPIVTSYPLYEANQLLDANSLNDSFNYLKQQIRLSRVGMGTVGQIIGHDFVVNTDSGNGKTITISSGFSVSIEGNILLLLNDYKGINSAVFNGQQPNDLPKVYKYYVTYQKKNGDPGITGDEFFRLIAPPFSANQDITLNSSIENLIESAFSGIEDSLELLTEEEASNWVDTSNPPILIGNIADLNTKMLTLYYETTSVENSNCNQNSCNDDGQVINIRTVALLVPKNDLLFPPVNYKAIEYDILHLQKFKVLSDKTNADANFANYRSTFNTVAKQNLRDIKSKLSQLRSDFDNFPITDFNSLGNVLNDSQLDAIINLIPDSGSTTIFHDHYHFGNTVRQAINEFITFHNQVFIDNIYESNSFHEKRRQRFVVLGRFDTPPDKMDNYTYYPVSIEKMTSAQNQFILLKKLYDRIYLLIFSFGRYKGLFNGSPYTSSPFSAQLPIAVQTQTTFPKVTPSRYLPALLGDQAIPSFFSFSQTGEDVQFLNYWKGKLLNQEKNTNGVFSIYDGGFPTGTSRLTNASVSLNVDSSEYNFYRIEGHIGQPLRTVLQHLQSVIKANNLNCGILVYNLNRGNVETAAPMKFPYGTECLSGVKAGGTFVLIVSKTSNTVGTDYTVMSDVSLDFYVPNYNMYYSYDNANTYTFDYFLHMLDHHVPNPQNWLNDPVIYNSLNRFYDAIQIFQQVVNFQTQVAPIDISISFTKVMKAAQLFPGGWKYAARMQATTSAIPPPAGTA